MEGSKAIVRQVIDEPVKEAVEEAYAEQRARADVEPMEHRDEQSEDGSGSMITLPRLLLPVAGAAGVAYLVRRRRKRKRSGSDRLEMQERESARTETDPGPT